MYGGAGCRERDGGAPVAGNGWDREDRTRHDDRHAVGWPVKAARRPEPRMSVARTVAEILAEHVTLEIEGIDRLYLNVYVPQLQHVGGVVGFFRGHRGQPIASSALMTPISRGFVAAIEQFVREQGVPLLTFSKGQRKDDVAKEHLVRFAATGQTEGYCSSARPRRRRRSTGPR